MQLDISAIQIPRQLWTFPHTAITYFKVHSDNTVLLS